MMCLIKVLNLLLHRRKPALLPVDPDLTFVTVADSWPGALVERPWWCGGVLVFGHLYTEDGVTDVQVAMNSATPCQDCGKPLTERKVVLKMDVDPALAEWRHVRCPDTLPR